MHQILLKIGPAAFRIASAWRRPLEELEALYGDYPALTDSSVDFTVRLEPKKPWRRFIRPSVHIGGDFWLPDAAPLPLAQGLLAAEMGMNLQMALGWRRHLLLHASSVEKDGKALVMTGLSGSGKSTLSAMLAERGWRFMGDEFALLDLETGDLVPFPRLISLKNKAIETMQQVVPEHRFGPEMKATPKGDIRHLIPPKAAVARMDETARPALLLFPRFGHAPELRDMGQSEVFVRLTQASTNYVALGESGFEALTRFVDQVPTKAMDYQSGEQAEALIESLWSKLP
ncbi:MAG: HprK-related kinase A [Sphingomonadales bacterium]|nr:HprK-related kinase A [Sphingomonadales bacterium]PIX65244.1 MAG: HprK-related kinase A [Sphingomonadales bacterium CG_4_10_14_3_um_filter_58_15]NCO49202.1 HprK-related kinase A [Sphingomonadales bacterium]NCP00174.1 HprK-related kinase A [Sphingomonadales bacterium]NCP27944.1 HprK-related kinase A [Sphingomonadales bacterium]